MTQVVFSSYLIAEHEVESDVISYTACIKACAKAGELDRALALFSAMEHFQVVPDKYTSAGLGLARIRTPETPPGTRRSRT